MCVCVCEGCVCVCVCERDKTLNNKTHKKLECIMTFPIKRPKLRYDFISFTWLHDYQILIALQLMIFKWQPVPVSIIDDSHPLKR